MIATEGACAKCGGDQYILTEAGEVSLCECSSEARAARIIRNSGLPKRFLNAGFRGFDPTTMSMATSLSTVKDWWRRLANHQTTDGLYLYGSVGTGKTHLACAAARNLAHDGMEFRFYSVPQLLFELRSTISRDSESEADILAPCEEVALLVLDDFGAEKLTDYARERLYLVFDNRYYRQLPTIVTSNLDAEGLARWDKRIASRIEGSCEMVHLVGPDYRQRKAKEATT